MAFQGVGDVRRLTTKRNGEIVNTTSVVLTITCDRLPKVFIGYESVTVRPFIPAPMRCFQCQRYGHIATRCEGKAICPRCGLDAHGDSSCPKGPQCVNCEGAHPAYSLKCPKMLEDRKIMDINITYFDARKKYRSITAPTFSKSFAKVVESTVTKALIGTQTETIPKNNTIEPAKPDKASIPAAKHNSNAVGSPKRNPTNQTTCVTQKKREVTPPPTTSGVSKSKLNQPESMEEDESLSETEILQAKKKTKKNRLRR
ncbi:uncharacterized protein LOC124159700 [Ischnura elegans]|uniref:uncharacterized protein LOC124159700 n=1 Tax=Ischnura elegans TaxID=197161 RepID=UPI001ED88A8F|nr:uncharacterized protein LOC124159700 [Ischnura elegans]